MYTNITTQGNTILLRELNGNLTRISNFKPECFEKTDEISEYKDIHGNFVKRRTFNSIKDSIDYKNRWKDVENKTILGDIRPESQFLFDYYDQSAYETVSKNDLRIFYYDIEVDCTEFPEPSLAKDPINGLCIFDTKADKYILWALSYSQSNKFENIDADDFREFDSEIELLSDVVQYWVNNYPDIIVGWNNETFDDPYIYNRIMNIISKSTADKLSPWGIVKYRSIKKYDKEYQCTNIYGVSQLDMMALYKKFSFTPQEKYSLDHIAYAELGDGKVDYSEHGSLFNLYRNDYNKFIVYNKKDVDILIRLEAKRNFIGMVVDTCYYSKTNFEEIFSPIRIWDSLIFHYLREQNIIVPKNKVGSKSESFKGAFVKKPLIGLHNWIVSVDLASLYPSIIRQCNISPEKLIDVVPDELLQIRNSINENDLINKTQDLSANTKYSMAANGQFFDKSESGFLPVLLEMLYNKRKADKKEMLQYEELYEETKAEIQRRGLSV